jgi:hypothetical protein
MVYIKTLGCWRRGCSLKRPVVPPVHVLVGAIGNIRKMPVKVYVCIKITKLALITFN